MPDYDYQSDDRPFSRVLEDIGAKPDPKLYLGEVVNAFGERAFGALLLVFGLLNALPLPPGATAVLGIPLLLLSVQLVLRTDQLWLPRWALKRSIDRAGYRKSAARISRPIRAIERLSQPRLLLLTSPVSETAIGLVCTLLAVIVMLPLWSTNMFPAFTIAVFGFGMMQRDGVAVLLGWLATAGYALFLVLAWRIIEGLLRAAWAWAGGLF
ncbi:MAG: exopolysaccharide biosynthesis protein [Brevundimonas sp.]|uniref:exopolysaccharide biosynthesis protein n=1 Tax=Brevundimonas sp. TaxID=1871086 RepID=UPI002719B551|nr:exopolysaccharide biosynthesis protein [Brevundimonas sp.]MDO9589138.1 exopolysaccharide biosynthesis protein [Brevundimonas sp.]MDP3657963.1 exopolysaccharide biosynthesis protein [Brevundimonas sp.]MDZ4111932.1 exopolysaccharide biosynthesis protein [Brevundimonas sp.]MDZ4317705.1 exopolysaccharide biosynthesis protein [Phenylobacterium sp.]